jgi:hypothetical protein
VHLRGAAPGRRRGLSPVEIRPGLILRNTKNQTRSDFRRLLVVLTIACLTAAACARGSGATDDISIELTLMPNPPVVGVPAQGTIVLRDRDRRLVRSTDMRIEAHMSHPGMTPVIANATERDDGMQKVPLQFTMAGDWTVHVTGTLADGRRLDRWLNVPGVRPAE